MSSRIASLFLTLCVASSISCRPAARPETLHAATPVGISLQVKSLAEGGWRPVPSGQTWRGGDRFTLVVEATQPLHVVVSHSGTDGSAQTLYEGRVTPSAPAQVPSGNGYYSVGAAPGHERIYVVASPVPLHEATLAAALHQLGTDRDPPPGQRDPKNRGDADTVNAVADATGVAALKYKIVH